MTTKQRPTEKSSLFLRSPTEWPGLSALAVRASQLAAAEREAERGRFAYFGATSPRRREPPGRIDSLESPRAARWALFYAHALEGAMSCPFECRGDNYDPAAIAAELADRGLRSHDARFPKGGAK